MTEDKLDNKGIIIVDDEDIILELGQRMISALGASVYKSANSEDAMEILKNEQSNIDLAIIDVVLPNMEGTELAEMMLDVKPNLKILFSSGYGTTEAMQKFLDEGKAMFIPKPFTREEVIEKITTILEI